MPMKYQIDREANLITLTAIGTVRFEDVVSAFVERVKDSDYTPGMNILCDGGNAEFEFSGSEMSRLVAFFKSRQEQRGGAFRFALVSTQDAIFGMGRMFESYAGDLPEEIRVFRDFDEARQWALGADAE
jgi:hypothetical protein